MPPSRKPLTTFRKAKPIRLPRARRIQYRQAILAFGMGFGNSEQVWQYRVETLTPPLRLSRAGSSRAGRVNTRKMFQVRFRAMHAFPRLRSASITARVFRKTLFHILEYSLK